LIDPLDGSERAKLIVRTLLETITGTRTIDSAVASDDAITTCNVLRALFAQYGVGICETRHGQLAIGTFTGVQGP